MRMSLLMRLVTPDPSRGDRPFDQRPYGRLRLTEPMANQLLGILQNEIKLLRVERRRLIDRGVSPELIAEVEEDLKLTRKIDENLTGMMAEKGW